MIPSIDLYAGGLDFGKNKAIMTDYILHSAVVWEGSVDGHVLGIWGLMIPTLLDDRAYLWFYQTPELDRYKFIFARYSRDVIAEIHSRYPRIVGHCVNSDLGARRWLRWLGATFTQAEGSLVPFEIRRA